MLEIAVTKEDNSHSILLMVLRVSGIWGIVSSNVRVTLTRFDIQRSWSAVLPVLSLYCRRRIEMRPT